MTESEKMELIRKTVKHEGGFGIDNDGYWVYMGINRGANPGWAGWSKIEQKINCTPANLTTNSKMRELGIYNKRFDDPLLEKDVWDLAAGPYWNSNFEKYNDKRIIANMFDHQYAAGPGGLGKVLDCAFGTSSVSGAADIANNMGDRALPKIMECRKQHYNSCTYAQPSAEPSAGKEGWNYYRRRAIKGVDDFNADWMGTGSGTQFQNTGGVNENLSRNLRDVSNVSNPLGGNWFLEHLGKPGSIFAAN